MKKRKEFLDYVVGGNDADDFFFDFSLSSPATKIRRLDASLSPIMEEPEPYVEAEPDVPMMFGHPVTPAANLAGKDGGSSIVIDEVTSVPANKERAIVLFKPRPLLQSALHPVSVSADSDLKSGYKNPIAVYGESNLPRPSGYETDKQEEKLPSSQCLAMEPWVRTHSQTPETGEVVDVSEMMDTEVAEAETMDIEEDSTQQQWLTNEFGTVGASGNFDQWPQHCMIPQAPQSLCSPVSLFCRQMG